MLSSLSELVWDDFFACNDPGEAWEILFGRLLEYLNRKYPIKNGNSKSKGSSGLLMSC